MSVDYRAPKWLKAAKWAASGGNCQPWLVFYQETKTETAFQLCVDPDYIKDASPMDVDGTATAIALGCLAYNLEAIAAQEGYRLTDKIFCKNIDFWTSSVKIFFSKDPNIKGTYSVRDLYNRRTDRGVLKKQDIDTSLLKSIDQITDTYKEVLTAVNASDRRNQVIKGLKPLEPVRWQNLDFLNSFLHEINFGKDMNKEVGIPVNQLGLKLPERIFINLIHRFPFLRFLFFIGSQFMVVKKGLVEPVKNCGGIYFLQAKKSDFASCFELGACFEHLWLEINKMNCSFQPMGSPLIALKLSRQEKMASREARALKKSRDYFAKNFSLDLNLPVLGFRIGYTYILPEKCHRKDIKAMWTEDLLSETDKTQVTV